MVEDGGAFSSLETIKHSQGRERPRGAILNDGPVVELIVAGLGWPSYLTLTCSSGNIENVYIIINRAVVGGRKKCSKTEATTVTLLSD